MELEPILFVPDTHAPFHNAKNWRLLIEFAKRLQPKHIICLGDFWDFYSVSSHSKDPRRQLRLHHEIEAGLKLHRQLDELGATNKVFIAGNHEDRLERYLSDKAPALFDMLPLKDILQLPQRNWKYVPYKQFYRLGRLFATHDTGCSGSGATSKARAAFEGSVVIGHTHRVDYRVSGNALGNPQSSSSFGWLGDASKADYMHRIMANRDWAQGFGVGFLHPPSGQVHVQAVPIVGGRAVGAGIQLAGDLKPPPAPVKSQSSVSTDAKAPRRKRR